MPWDEVEMRKCILLCMSNMEMAHHVYPSSGYNDI